MNLPVTMVVDVWTLAVGVTRMMSVAMLVTKLDVVFCLLLG